MPAAFYDGTTGIEPVDTVVRRVLRYAYPIATEAVTRAVVGWAESHYRWSIDPQWIVWLPGLVPGIHLACQTLAESGDEVLTLCWFDVNWKVRGCGLASYKG